MSNGYVSTEDFEAEIQRLERKIEGIPQGSVIRDAVVFGYHQDWRVNVR